jgi:predicted kinase
MSQSPPTLHLIYGFVGAGKTTFAKKLEKDTKAVRFTPDEWMIALYGDRAEDFQDKQNRITLLVYDTAKKILATGTDVILDFGFWSRKSRDHARAFARDCGVSCKLYNLQCAEDVMRRRVIKRTAEMPAGALFIDDNAFNEFKTRLEPLREDEDAVLIRTDF